MAQDETAEQDDAATEEILSAEVSLQAEKADTAEVFLTNLSETLKASDGVDADLAAILTNHLLTITPQANAVADARSAIVAIALKRAAPSQENAGG